MKKTSIEAYEQLVRSGRKLSLRLQVFGYILKHPGCTQPDISRDINESGRKRISELLRDNLVYKSGTTRINNLNYMTYNVLSGIQTELNF